MLILWLFFTQRVYDNEIDGMMTQIPKNAQEDDKQSCILMNGYLKEREKVVFTIKHKDAMSSYKCFSMKSNAMLKILEMPSNIQTNH